jgi:hypothetical protein
LYCTERTAFSTLNYELRRKSIAVSSHFVVPGRLLPLLVLLAYGVAFGTAAFGLATPGFDDHPGQLFRLHHLIARGPAPWAWNPDWWAGYPELQFYPPGYFYLGALLVWSSLGTLSVSTAYQALLWLTWLAPGLTVFLALARLAGSGWLALPGAFVALTLSAGVASGVEGGVHIGMLPARLGWSLLPLLLLALHGWMHGRSRQPWLAVPLLAAIVLLHPAHLPAAVALLGLAAWTAPGRRGERLATVALTLGLAAAVTGFWTLPLVWRLEHTRALAWGRLEPLPTLTQHPLLVALLVLALAAPGFAPRGPARAVASWPWAAAALVTVDALVLEAAGLQWLPADRVSDGVWLAAVLAASLAAGPILGSGAPLRPGRPGEPDLLGEGRRRRTRRLLTVGLSLGLALAFALSLRGGTLTLWPRAAQWPSLGEIERGLRLDALWAAVRSAPDGRVLFVRSGVPLVYGTEWWRPHTHATALAPVRAGREILNGTFTHPSPLAALVYRGDAGPGPIITLVERLDGHTLFGRRLEDLDAATLNGYAERLGVTLVVALDEDAPRLRALADNPIFRPRPPVGPFRLFDRIEPVALPAPTSDGRSWVLPGTGVAGAWVPARMAYYPLWRAEQAGAPLPTRRGGYGDLELRVGPASGPITLAYAPRIPEITGVVLSALGVGAWLAWRWPPRTAGAGPGRRRP